MEEADIRCNFQVEGRVALPNGGREAGRKCGAVFNVPALWLVRSRHTSAPRLTRKSCSPFSKTADIAKIYRRRFGGTIYRLSQHRLLPMARITRMRRLQSLQLSLPSQCAARRPSFAAARAISTTSPSQGKNTEWVRGKLWKGEAPGPADPYTQRMEPETTSNLPEEALESRPRQDKTPAAVRGTRLALPYRRSEAPTEKELQASDPTYVPATEAEGLEEIGALSTWWEQPGHWGEESAFKGFGSSEKVVEREVLEVYLRRAVVEALALQQTGVFSEWATKKWSEGGSRNELEQALALQVEVQDGKATLKGDASSVAEALTSELSEAESTDKISVEEAKEMIKSWDPSWKNIALDNSLRFAVSPFSRKRRPYENAFCASAPQNS